MITRVMSPVYFYFQTRPSGGRARCDSWRGRVVSWAGATVHELAVAPAPEAKHLAVFVNNVGVRAPRRHAHGLASLRQSLHPHRRRRWLFPGDAKLAVLVAPPGVHAAPSGERQGVVQARRHRRRRLRKRNLGDRRDLLTLLVRNNPAAPLPVLPAPHREHAPVCRQRQRVAVPAVHLHHLLPLQLGDGNHPVKVGRQTRSALPVGVLARAVHALSAPTQDVSIVEGRADTLGRAGFGQAVHLPGRVVHWQPAPVGLRQYLGTVSA
mmetsp:Transcript_6055/g.14961  ORF Transcript_6055/g.14961 Transcript_6055/m.14961 type:complete len:266 (+) Transcript_6055:41-838(+)